MRSNIRIIHKHAVEDVWKTKGDFIPYSGEFIVFDPDTTYNYSRIKIGDGKTTLDRLPFAKSEAALTADKLSSERIIRLEGFITGEAAFNGSKDIQLRTSLTQPLSATFVGATSAHAHNFNGVESTGTSEEYTPEGVIEYEFKPAGSVTAPEIVVTPTTATMAVVTGKVNSSSFTPATYTAPSLTAKKEDDLLVIDFVTGSYTPAQYIEGELTSEVITYVTSVSATASTPVFEGTIIQGSATFKGAPATITTKFTPQGTISETSIVPEGTITLTTTEKEDG